MRFYMVGELVVLWGGRGTRGIRRDCREPGMEGRNAKTGRTDLPSSFPSSEGTRRPQDDHTGSLCQGLSPWHNCAIVSSSGPRALPPWLSLITGFTQGPGKVKTAHLQVLNLASFRGCFCSSEVLCLAFTVRDFIGNLCVSSLFSYVIWSRGTIRTVLYLLSSNRDSGRYPEVSQTYPVIFNKTSIQSRGHCDYESLTRDLRIIGNFLSLRAKNIVSFAASGFFREVTWNVFYS